MAFYKPHSTLWEMALTKTKDKVSLVESKCDREIIGSLKYVMVATRPDICYTVTRLSQDLTKPNSFHLMKAQSIIHEYLRNHKNP